VFPLAPPKSLNLKPPSSFQPVPLIPIVPKITKSNIYCTQDLDLVMNDQIVQHPWEQNPPQSPLSTNNLMDATQLDALFQMAFFFPFNMIDD